MSCMRRVSFILSGLVSSDVQSDSKVSTTFAEIVKMIGVKFLLILLAKKDKDGKITGYTDLDFIPDSNEDNMLKIHVVTENGHS